MAGEQRFQVINLIKVRDGNSKINQMKRKQKGEGGEKEKQKKQDTEKAVLSEQHHDCCSEVPSMKCKKRKRIMNSPRGSAAF